MKDTPDIQQQAILRKRMKGLFPALMFFMLSLLLPIQSFGDDGWWEGVCKKAE